MRIGNKGGPMAHQLRAQVAAVETGEPETVLGQSRVTAADHFKFKIGNDPVEGHRRMVEEVSISVASDFFRAKEDEEQGARGASGAGKDTRQLNHGGGSGSIVIGPVINPVAVFPGANPEVIQMRA